MPPKGKDEPRKIISSVIRSSYPVLQTMIAYLSGIVSHLTPRYCLINTGPVGYEVEAPIRTLQALTQGEAAELYIYTYVREDQLKLFGFETILERDLFTLLIGISGVGPKAALSILSAGTVELIQHAIVKADVTFFTTIKGLGKKTAQKIIIDLKSKLGSLEELDLSDNQLELYSQDVVDALTSFGFMKRDIVKVLETMDKALSESEQIKLAIQILGKG